MTANNMEARRQAFEAWYESQSWPLCERCSSKEIECKAWNAALDSICVELPSTENMQGNELKVLYEVKAAMRAAGVKYK